MKKKYLLTICLLFAAQQAYAADQPLNETVQVQTQGRVQLQDKIHNPVQDKDQLRSQDQLQTNDRDQIRIHDPIEKNDQAYLQTMHRHQFKEQNIVRIQNMIQDAQKKGLPTEPLMSKIHEGIAKKVNEEQVTLAVERVRNRYENAYQYAATLTTDKQLAGQLGQITAEAMTAGLKDQDCEQLMQQLQIHTRLMNQLEAHELAIQTMTTARVMSRRGVSSETVSDVLNNALEQTYQHREMNTLQHRFVERTKYDSAEDVARGFSSDISRGSQASDLGSGVGGAGGSGGSGGSSDSGGSGDSSGSGGSGDSGSSGDSSGSGGSGDSGSSGGSSGSGGSGDSGSSGGSSGSGGSGGNNGGGR